jgi:ADP-heptose:LPS heptosyltransferase
MRILLGQLSANGDCLHATVLARQIKLDHPEAHLTWAVSSLCRTMLLNNPDVDELWVVPVRDWSEQEHAWRVFSEEARQRTARGEFDKAVLSQIWPDNFQNFDGTVRPSVLRSYGKRITTPVRNTIRLTDEEQERVDAFVRDARLQDFEHRILFECSSRSAQSFMTPALAAEVAQHLYELLPNTTVVFSTDQTVPLQDSRSRSGRELSLRETAGLTHACSLVVGCGSGVSVVAISTAAKRLPMVQILSRAASVFGSVAHDLEFFEDGGEEILETTERDAARLAQTIARVCAVGAPVIVQEGGWRLPILFPHYLMQVEAHLLRPGRVLDAVQSLQITAARYGWTPELRAFARTKVLESLENDPASTGLEGRARISRFRAELHEADQAGPDTPTPQPYRLLPEPDMQHWS